MTTSQRIILFVFAGRWENMSIQIPYFNHLLEQWPGLEVHLWDLTRNPSDQRKVRMLHGVHDGRVTVLTHLHPGHPIRCIDPSGRRRGRYRCTCMKHTPPYEEPYKWYAEQESYADAVFVKVDDDVLFLETKRFADLIEPLGTYPNRVISANVVNNAVCAKYEPDLVEWLTGPNYGPALGDPTSSASDRAWWNVHTDAGFARGSHEWFLNNVTDIISGSADKPAYVRTRPGEAISINCIAFTHRTMRRLAASFHHDPRLGDEGAVDRMLPWIARSFHAAHLTFGPQDQAMNGELDVLRKRYADLTEEYLDE